MAYSILVVDDDPKILKILQHTFSKEGFKVAIAASGEEALQIARQSPPRPGFVYSSAELSD